MKKAGMSRIFMVIATSLFIFLCFGAGWAEEWIQINPLAFENKGDAASSFQEALFDANYLYVVTSDLDFRFEDLNTKDPNRTTILWASKIYKDPNAWNNKVHENPNLWEKIMFEGSSSRVDRLFRGFGYIYAGLDNYGDCRIYRFSYPDQKQEVTIDIDTDIRAKWLVDNGEEFGNRLYIGIYDKDYGGRIFRTDSPSGPIEDNHEVKNIPGIQVSDRNRKISLLKRINDTGQTGERLFAGTKNLVPGKAVLSYTYDTYGGNTWDISGEDTFKDPDLSEDIVAFLSTTEFLGEIWLLTELKKDGKKQWALWNIGIGLHESQWEKQISSQDPDGPFTDPNIIAVSELQPIGEYLYLACLCKDGGRIWKSYRGEYEEWTPVPSPSDPNNRFGPDNLLRGIFFNPNDIDHIYAGTKNDKGIQILTRLVPRMVISTLSIEDRFVGPEEPVIRMDITPNWGDPDYWEDPNHLPPALVFSGKDPNAAQNQTVYPNQTASSLWEWGFDPNKFTKEGIYNLKWELTYGKDREKVARYLSFAWDANAPAPPKNLKVGEGDGRLEIQWEPSSDSFEDIEDLEDTNFSRSIMQYELRYWPKDEEDQDTNIIYPVRDPDGVLQPNRIEISGLQNNTTYYIQVRARDKAGNLSEGSEVVEGTPQPTLGWLELLDEKGGCFISSVSSEEGKDAEGSRRWFAGLKAGNYEPSSEEADLVYGDDRAWAFQVEIGWIHRPYLEVSLGTGYLEMEGMAVKILTGEKSIDPVTFRMIPSSMTFRWIPIRGSGHILVPYLGCGIDAWWYQEDELKGKDISGWNYGYHGLCGVRFLLDRLDSKHADSLEKDFRVRDTYLTLEVVYNRINDFEDSRLDLGGALYQVGILFLF